MTNDPELFHHYKSTLRPIANYNLTGVMAVGANGVIGLNNSKMPWRSKSDLQFFKYFTTEYANKDMRSRLLFGRTTFDSLPKLDTSVRDLFVLSSTLHGGVSYTSKNGFNTAQVINELPQLWSGDESGLSPHMYLCGGAEVYNTFMAHCRFFVVTHIMETNADSENMVVQSWQKVNMDKFNMLFKPVEVLNYCAELSSTEIPFITRKYDRL